MLISRRGLLAASPAMLLAGRLGWMERLGLAADTGGRGDSWEFTAAADKSIKRGNAFLLTTMNRDGGCGVDVGSASDIGCTAMAGLSLLSQGNNIREGQYCKQVQNITNYLLRCVKLMPSDDITSENQTQLQNKIGRHAHTFFATLFLSQLVGEDWESAEFEQDKVRKGLAKLVKTVAQTQTSEGHWGTTSWAPMLGNVMGWCCLRGAHYAGFKVTASANKTANYIAQSMEISMGNQGWMHELYKNASGIRVLHAMGKGEGATARRAFEDALSLVSRDNTGFAQAGGEEYLAYHLITEAMLQKGDKEWKRWYPAVRDKAIAAQNADGSWTGHHCITSRTFCTAAAVLVLSAPNRYLPVSQQ